MKFSNLVLPLALSKIALAHPLFGVETVIVTEIETVVVTEGAEPATMVVSSAVSTISSAAEVSSLNFTSSTPVSSVDAYQTLAATASIVDQGYEAISASSSGSTVSTTVAAESTSASATQSSISASASQTSASSQGTFSGDGTFYSTGLGACGQVSQDTDYIVAISQKLYDQYTPNGNSNDNTLCGKKITAHYEGNSVEVTVVDSCVGCSLYDLDFSPSAFSQLASQDLGRISITWNWS